MTTENIQEIEFLLESELREASQAYYTGNDIMSDAVFEYKWDYLKQLNPTNSIFSEISKGYKLNGIDDKEKFEHPILVDSVPKIKDIKELKNKLKPGATFSTKLDGNSIVAYYKNGQLQDIVTRGSENIGIKRTAKLLKKVATIIPLKGYIAVRGEAVIKKSLYKASKFFDADKTSRSAVSGAITRKENYVEVINCIDFIAYTFVDCDTGEDLVDAIDWSTLFKVEKQKSVDIFYEMSLEDFKKKYKDDCEYDADGIVFKNPDGTLLAFKFEDESTTTKLQKILWTIGRDQRLTPVAILKPVNLCGATISKASVGSYSKLLEKRMWPVLDDHTVELTRANEVIPHIEHTVVKSGNIVQSDVICPSCGSIGETDGDHIFCVNHNCKNLTHSKLIAFSEFFYPEGLSTTTVNKFFTAYNINTISELLDFNGKLNKEIYGIGDSAKDYFKEFLSKLKQDIDVKVLYATFLKSCGESSSEKIVNSGFDIHSYIKNPKAAVANFPYIPNFNSNTVASLLTAYPDILEIYNKITVIQNVRVLTSSFCITGARFKGEDKERILQKGWSEDSTLKKTTTVLVVKDPSSTSTKVEKAKKYGTKIMSIEQFLKTYID